MLAQQSRPTAVGDSWARKQEQSSRQLDILLQSGLIGPDSLTEAQRKQLAADSHRTTSKGSSMY